MGLNGWAKQGLYLFRVQAHRQSEITQAFLIRRGVRHGDDIDAGTQRNGGQFFSDDRLFCAGLRCRQDGLLSQTCVGCCQWVAVGVCGARILRVYRNGC